MTAPKDDYQRAAAEGESIPRPPDARRPVQIGTLADKAIRKMLGRAEGSERPIETPWPGVNKAMRGGFWPGLYTLTSGTGTGKTQWAVQVAVGAARALEGAGERVRYIALELGEDELVARVLGELAGEQWSDLLYGAALNGEKTHGAITAAAETHGAELRALPLDVETADAIGWTYAELLKIGNEPRPPRLVVLDYTQLVGAPEGVRAELRETIGNVAKVARDLARRRGVTVLALSSTARVNYEATSGADSAPEKGKPKKKPLLPGQGDPSRFIALGKESGELEYTADVVMALVREPEEEDPLPGQARGVWVAFAKGRGFPAGWARLLWNGTRFYEEQGAAPQRKAKFEGRR